MAHNESSRWEKIEFVQHQYRLAEELEANGKCSMEHGKRSKSVQSEK